ncbi:MAG: hypothetical protein IPL32_01100 [Chloracidobacterium sp.]|nr:hypothetical protein [Chloracidobacterium sp.]
MYKNRLNRTTPNITPNSHPHLFIQSSVIEFARVDHIEGFCVVLIEGRFGPDFVYKKMENPTDRLELEPALVYDLSDDGEVSLGYDLSPQGRKGYQTVEAAHQKAKSIAFAATSANSTDLTAASSSNQGRGSP